MSVFTARISSLSLKIDIQSKKSIKSV
ncbi:uncharacterized protein Dmoj_GI26041 [Drosophila mojavensis]|uniref:Uncharacterized protein n=1 Tax=Drosophila mojavensis TaxID=7230 RepID=A0A0Q9XMC2_DROMO|nr:uncharacterized protein Dmoj_GI26041 [Drosophila mojavensis]